jgi:hypothetical protein
MKAIFLCSSDACWGVLGEDMLMGIYNVSLISWIFDRSRYSLSLEELRVMLNGQTWIG